MIKRKILAIPLIAFISFIFLYSAQAQMSNKRELRGAWLTTYLGLDWPNRLHTPVQQQNSLISILDTYREMGLNTVYFQVRSQSDAMYQSSIEPWSFDLTGSQGTPPIPFWDPLHFAIAESKKRGLEFHAWINPFRAVATFSNTNNQFMFSARHISKANPEWLLTVGKVQILNPGLHTVRSYVNSVIVDILKRYDIDGIHFDDYFYPTGVINDNAAYLADPRGYPNTTAGRADWRRDNLNMFIKDVYDSIKTIKPWVKFGISPTGIYRSSINPEIGSSTSTGALQHYSAYFADTRRWLKEGWVDYIAPQLYWHIGKFGSDYGVLVPWWNSNAFGRHIYAGLAAYNVGTTGWTNRSEIPNQIRINRNPSNSNIKGAIFFRVANLIRNPLNVKDSLRLNFYQKPALQPTMPWRDNEAPNAASNLTAVRFGNDSVVLNWNKPEQTKDELQKVKQFVIYRSTKPSIDINDEKNILLITVNDTTAYTDVAIEPNTTYYYTVTSLDRFHNESKLSNVADNLDPVVNCPGEQKIKMSGSFYFLPDYRLLTIVDGIPAFNNRLVNIIQTPAPGTKISGRGITSVTLTAIDKAGKSGFCTFIVNGKDTATTDITKVSTENNGGQANKNTVQKENNTSGLVIKVGSNPTKNYFTIIINSKSKKYVSIKVLDSNGKTIDKKKKLSPNSSFVLGGNYPPGSYYLHVKQEKETQEIKLVKSSK